MQGRCVMNKIKEHITVTGSNNSDLDSKINMLLSKDYELYKHAYVGPKHNLCQAMVKYESKPQELEFLVPVPTVKHFEQKLPHLDWQNNNDNNKPKEGIEVLVKSGNLYYVCKFLLGQWTENSLFWGPDKFVEKWAYIPE